MSGTARVSKRSRFETRAALRQWIDKIATARCLSAMTTRILLLKCALQRPHAVKRFQSERREW